MIAAWVVGVIVAYIVGCGVTAACVEDWPERDEGLALAAIMFWPFVLALTIPYGVGYGPYLLTKRVRDALEDRARQKRLPEARVVK